MPRTPQSKGACIGCKVAFGRMAIHRHLDQCKKIVGGVASCAGATVGRLRIAIDTADASPYWIVVDAHPNATLKELDDFLRELWLECCGHLSVFHVGGQGYALQPMTEETDSTNAFIPAFEAVGERRAGEAAEGMLR